MKIEKGLIEFDNGFIISYWQTITEIFTWRKYNWNVWQFINIEFENDTWTGSYEFTFVFLLCGICIRIPHRTKKSDEFKKRTSNSMKRIENSCYGWTTEKAYNDYKSKKENVLIIWNKRKDIPEDESKFKKLFIQ